MNHRVRFLSLLLLLGSGCAYLKPVSVSTSPLDPDRETILGPAQGRALNVYFLGMLNSQEETLKTAMDEAKKKSGADTLINVTVDRRVTYYPLTILPLLVRDETWINGTAVRYKVSATTSAISNPLR